MKTKSNENPNQEMKGVSTTDAPKVHVIPTKNESQPVEKTVKVVKKAAKVNKTGENSGMTSLYKRVTLFLRQAKVELKKVKWPTRKELIASTVVVIVLTMLVSCYLGLVDLGLIKIIKNVIG